MDDGKFFICGFILLSIFILICVDKTPLCPSMKQVIPGAIKNGYM